MSNPNNGGTCFVCSSCHRTCSCCHESLEPGVCAACYDSGYESMAGYQCSLCDATCHCNDESGNHFVCSVCHRCCPCTNESVESGVCVSCYAENNQPGGTLFKCSVCHRDCHCLNESSLDGVCVECLAAAQRFGFINSVSGIFRCGICHKYRLNSSRHKGSEVCRYCYSNIELSPNLYISSSALTNTSISYMKSRNINVVARYLNNSNLYAFERKNEEESEKASTIEEYLKKDELDLARKNNMMIVSVYHSWKKQNTDNTSASISAKNDAFLATELAKKIHQPKGSTIYFEIPDRLKFLVSGNHYVYHGDNGAIGSFYYDYINNYLSELENCFSANNYYNYGVICGNDSQLPQVFSYHNDVIQLYVNRHIPVLVREKYDYKIENFEIIDLVKPFANVDDRFGKVMLATRERGSLGAWLPVNYCECKCTHNSLGFNPATTQAIDGYEKTFGYDSSDPTQEKVQEYLTVANSNWSAIGATAPLSHLSFYCGYLNLLEGRHLLAPEDLTRQITQTAGNQTYGPQALAFVSLYQADKTSLKTYFNKRQGEYDAIAACLLAGKLGQPDGKPIYFAVDDTVLNDDSSQYWIGYPLSYFDGIFEVMNTIRYNPHHYAVGLYGPQSLVEALRSFTSNSPSVPAVRKNVYFFRPYSPAYSGNYSTSEYNIRQHLPNYGGQDYDIDETSESYDSGAWNKTVLL